MSATRERSGTIAAVNGGRSDDDWKHRGAARAATGLWQRPRLPAGHLLARVEDAWQLLANINGKARREIAREVLDNEGFGGLTAFTARAVLDDEECREWGAVHPWLMGGEYLPKLAEGEVEIARISLKSTTADQISVRARQVQGRIYYAVVDEYEMSYRLLFDESGSPLSLGELIAFLDGSVNDEDQYAGGLVISHWNSCLEYEDAEEAAVFATVESAWYPDLEEYYCRVAVDWVEEHSPDTDV